MWRLAEEKEMEVFEEESHKALEEARQEKWEHVNAIKSTWEVVAKALPTI
jgi:hypothetical protein